MASETVWMQPVIKSDYPPVDPKQWDMAKKEISRHGRTMSYHYNDVVNHVINYAGIWSVFDEIGIEEVVSLYKAPVYGLISIWGRVARFTKGYRSEWCMVQKLFIVKKYVLYHWNPHVIQQLVPQFEKRYGCDVEVV